MKIYSRKNIFKTKLIFAASWIVIIIIFGKPYSGPKIPDPSQATIPPVTSFPRKAWKVTSYDDPRYNIPRYKLQVKTFLVTNYKL